MLMFIVKSVEATLSVMYSDSAIPRLDARINVSLCRQQAFRGDTCGAGKQ
ncbi:hypothetical protein OK016_24770 [Vibrio chagasii]|nr:hypothetical protein [Vibrio chagasii]